MEKSKKPEPSKKPYVAPTCRELGRLTDLTKAKAPGAMDGRKSKI